MFIKKYFLMKHLCLLKLCRTIKYAFINLVFVLKNKQALIIHNNTEEKILW